MDLAAIVERDRAYTVMGVDLSNPQTGRMQMAADRRALLALLRETQDALRSVLALLDENAPDPADVDRDVLEPARAALAALDTEVPV